MASLLMQGGCAIPAPVSLLLRGCRWCCGDVAAKGRGKGKEQACPQHSHSVPSLSVPVGLQPRGRGGQRKESASEGSRRWETRTLKAAKETRESARPSSSLVLRSLREKSGQKLRASFLP